MQYSTKIALREALDAFLEAAALAGKRRALTSLEKRLQRAFRRFFRTQGRLVVTGAAKLRRHAHAGQFLEAQLVEADPPDLPDLDQLLEELVKAGIITDAAINKLAMGILEKALEAGAEAALKAADVSIVFDLESPAAVKFLQDRGAELIAQITDGTRADLRGLIVDAVRDGKSYDELANDITAMFEDFSDSRARLIAVTEIGNAYEEGALLASQALEQAGLNMEKAWLTAGDDRVEPECEANAEAGWIALGEDFPSGDARPLAHPRCRCTLMSRRKPKEQALQRVA